MSLAAGNAVLASDMNELKTRYNNEMARRKYTGSLASYNNSFNPAVSGGVELKVDHQNKVVAGMRALNATSMPALATSGTRVDSLVTLSNRLNTNRNASLTANSSDCTTACSGLCHTACSGSCRGCSGCTNACTSCKGCTNACSGCKGCTNACSGCKGCTNACTSCKGCTDVCTSCRGCTATCADSCDTNCYWRCTQVCANGARSTIPV